MSKPKECIDCGEPVETGSGFREGRCRTCWHQRKGAIFDIEMAREEDAGLGNVSGGCSPLSGQDQWDLDRRIDRDQR